MGAGAAFDAQPVVDEKADGALPVLYCAGRTDQITAAALFTFPLENFKTNEILARDGGTVSRGVGGKF